VATTLSSAEVFNASTQTWSAAGNTMSVQRTTEATLINTGADARDVILPGGVDVEAGTYPSTCVPVSSLRQAAQSETDLYDPSTNMFTATGSLNQAREGQAQGQIGAGTDMSDILVVGGACTTTTPSLQSAPIGTSGNSGAQDICASTNGSGTGCASSASAEKDYAELFNQGTGTWSCIASAPASGFTPSNTAAAAVLP
jgi:hypothetical protein